MAEIADWQRKNYKKVESFADGGLIEDVQSPPEQLSLTEEERQKQEEAREVKPGKEKKSVGQMTPIAPGKIDMTPDRFQYPEYRDDSRYTRMLEQAVGRVTGFADGGKVKKGKC